MLSPEEKQLRQYIADNLKLSADQLTTDPVAFEYAQRYINASGAAAELDPDSEQYFEFIESTLRLKHMLVHNIEDICARARSNDDGEVGQYFERLYTDVSINKAGTHAVVTFQPQRAAPIPPAFVYTPTTDDLLQCVAETYDVYFNKLLRRQRTEDHHNQHVTVTLRWMYKTDDRRQIFDVVMFATAQ